MKSVNLTDHQWRTLRLIIDHATYDIDGWIELSEEDENPARKHAYESLTADAVSIDHHIASQTHIRAYDRWDYERDHGNTDEQDTNDDLVRSTDNAIHCHGRVPTLELSTIDINRIVIALEVHSEILYRAWKQFWTDYRCERFPLTPAAATKRREELRAVYQCVSDFAKQLNDFCRNGNYGDTYQLTRKQGNEKV